MKTLVFLPGLSFECTLWNKVTKYLLNKDMQFHFIDFPHYGTIRSGKRVDIPYLAEYLKDEVKKRHIETPFTLVGHSLGGVVATEFTSKYPELIDKLILTSTPLRDPNSSFPKRYSFAINTIYYLNFLTPIVRRMFRIANLIMRARLSHSKYMKYQDLFAFTEYADSKAICGCFRDIRRFELLEKIKKIQKKTLIVYGKQDFLLLNVHGKDYYDKFSDAKIIELNSPHSIPIMFPEEVSKYIEEFIK
ncbi:MAG: alpha/beta hydrolase [bacterium]